MSIIIIIIYFSISRFLLFLWLFGCTAVIIVNWFAAAAVIMWTILIGAGAWYVDPKNTATTTDNNNKFELKILMKNARMHFVNARMRVLNFALFV